MNFHSWKALASGFVLILVVNGCVRDPSVAHQARLRKIYSSMQFKYEKEIGIMSDTRQSDSQKVAALEQEILVKNDEHNAVCRASWFCYNEFEQYPYLQYRTIIERDINRLATDIHRSPYADEQLLHRARTLLRQLQEIKRIVVTHKKYDDERMKKAEIDAQYAIAQATEQVAIQTAAAAIETHHLAQAIQKKPAEHHHHYHAAPETVVIKKKTVVL